VLHTSLQWFYLGIRDFHLLTGGYHFTLELLESLKHNIGLKRLTQRKSYTRVLLMKRCQIQKHVNHIYYPSWSNIVVVFSNMTDITKRKKNQKQEVYKWFFYQRLNRSRVHLKVGSRTRLRLLVTYWIECNNAHTKDCFQMCFLLHVLYLCFCMPLNGSPGFRNLISKQKSNWWIFF